MSVAMRRLVPGIASLVLVAGIPTYAQAQVTIHITTTQQTSCDVTTDASGLRLSGNGTDLIATGATLSGNGCGGGSGPPTPNNFPLTVSANPLTGTPFTVSWSVTGATSCSGSATLGGAAASLSGWTDVTTPDSPRSVLASTAGTYTLSLTCSNTGGSVTSLPTQVVVGQGGSGACPTLANGRTQATVSDINYNPGNHLRRSVDLTQWNNIWGHITESDDVTPWPGANGSSPTIKTLSNTQYIGAVFQTGNVAHGVTGFYIDASYYGGPPIDATISQNCGDFSPATAACSTTTSGYPNGVPDQDQPFLHWYVQGSSNAYCELQPNTTYYFNMQYHDLAPCATGTCEETFQHNHN